jgi:hypothetical protein
MQLENFSLNMEMIKSGKNFLGILNDIKRRPEDAAKELQISLDENNLIMNLDYYLGNNSHIKVRCKSFIGKMVNQKCLYLESLKILKHIKIKSDIKWETT